MVTGTWREARPAGSATSARTRGWRSTSRGVGSGVTGAEVIIVEGSAVELVAPASPLGDRILAGYAKYRPGYEASAEHWKHGGLWQLRPTKAFAWTTFPDDMTRFTFEADEAG